MTMTLGVIAILLAYMCHLMPSPPRWWSEHLSMVPWPTGWAKIAFALAGSFAVFSSKLGALINRATTSVSAWADSHGFVSWVGTGAMTVTALAVAAVLVVKLVNQELDSQAMNMSAALPFLVAAIPGAIGAAFAGLLSVVAGGVAWLLSLGFG